MDINIIVNGWRHALGALGLGWIAVLLPILVVVAVILFARGARRV